MQRAIIAVLAFCAAMLFPNWAAAHVLRLDDVQPSQLTNDERERLKRLKDEYLPIHHTCPATSLPPATIRAQDTPDIIKDHLIFACTILQEIENEFHALMGTDPENVIDFESLEILTFRTGFDLSTYHEAVYGVPSPSAGFYLYGGNSKIARIWWVNRGTATLEHEYAHHLDHLYNGARSLTIEIHEGFAEYMQWGDFNPFASRIIGDGSNLPSFRHVWTTHGFQYHYRWRYLAVRFLFEEHADVIRKLYSMIRDGEQWSMVVAHVEENILHSLADDFDRWLRAKIPPTVIRQIEPITLLVVVDRFGNPFDVVGNRRVSHPRRDVFWRRYIRTTLPWEDLTVSVSLSVPHDTGRRAYSVFASTQDIYVGVETDVLEVGSHRQRRPATLEATLTVTDNDGHTAQQTFKVNLEHIAANIEFPPIENPQPLSTVEGTAKIDLSAYYDVNLKGLDFEEVTIVVWSGNADVVRVEKRGGLRSRSGFNWAYHDFESPTELVITPLAAGEAEVYIRVLWYGYVLTRTFTVTVTDDCPAYLCRGFFSGWRKMLLEDGQALPATETE